MKTIKTKKLWRLLEMAIEDIKAIHRKKNFVIQMNNWVSPQSDGTCAVCLAGAIAVCRLDITALDFSFQCNLDEHTKRCLFAINSLRTGDVRSAYRTLNQIRGEDVAADFPVAEWDNANPRPFYKSMWNLVKYLKSKNL